MEPAQAEVDMKDEKAIAATAAAAATGSAAAEEESTPEGNPAADTKPPAAAGEQGSSETGATAGGATLGNDLPKGQEGSNDAAGLWMYLDGVNPAQHGPLTESAMLKLLRIGTAHKDMMAWSQGMSGWKPLGQVSKPCGLPRCCLFSCVLFYPQAHRCGCAVWCIECVSPTDTRCLSGAR